MNKEKKNCPFEAKKEVCSHSYELGRFYENKRLEIFLKKLKNQVKKESLEKRLIKLELMDKLLNHRTNSFLLKIDKDYKEIFTLDGKSYKIIK